MTNLCDIISISRLQLCKVDVEVRSEVLFYDFGPNHNQFLARKEEAWEKNSHNSTTLNLKGPYHVHYWSFNFHLGLQWSNIAQSIIQKPLDLQKTVYLSPLSTDSSNTVSAFLFWLVDRSWVHICLHQMLGGETVNDTVDAPSNNTEGAHLPDTTFQTSPDKKGWMV